MKIAAKVRTLLRILGPGFVTGAADDDPSGIATYAQTGVQFGYSQLWTMLFSLPCMIAVQEMCARIGMVTGKGLAGVIRKHYSPWLLGVAVFLLLLANIINIGADLGAMAASGQLVFGGPMAAWVVGLTVLTVLLEVFVSYHAYAQVLKWLALSLLAYVLTAFVVRQPWGEVLRSTLLPHFALSGEYLFNIVAVLGTTISPYLFFWQANQQVEQQLDQQPASAKGIRPRTSAMKIGHMRQDTVVGMSFSNLVAFFIITTSASTIGAHGKPTIESAAQAAEALRPLAGNGAFVLFALGVVGTGLLAVPVLAGSAAYALAESLQWRASLSLKLKQARWFYAVIALATFIGMALNFTAIPPFAMLYYSAMLNGLCAPPLLVLILLIANNKKIMGQRGNGRSANLLGWAAAIVMGVCAIALVWSAPAMLLPGAKQPQQQEQPATGRSNQGEQRAVSV